jgi:hypothetical protein
MTNFDREQGGTIDAKTVAPGALLLFLLRAERELLLARADRDVTRPI